MARKHLVFVTRFQRCGSQRMLRPRFLACASLLCALLAVSQHLVWADAPQALQPATRGSGAVSPKLLRYAERTVRKHDSNHNGQLDADEWAALQGQPSAIDTNGDGRITVEEFAQHAADFGAGRAIRLSSAMQQPAENPPTADQPPAAAAAATDPRRSLKYFASLPAGLGPWFIERDADGDGQLTLAEYSPKLLRSELDDFARLDSNRDGVLTAQEYLRAGKETSAAGSTNVQP
jgi:hypothetical protein